MAELAHDATTCLVCRAKAEAPRRLVQALALFAAGLCITSGILDLRPATHTHRSTVARAHPVRAPEAPRETRRAGHARLRFVHAKSSAAARDTAATALERDAAVGVSRSFFDGGVFTTAARVAQWRPQVVRAAQAAGVDPNLLEAIVWVESSGRADVTNGTAVGLTQLRPWVARSFGLHVDARHAAVLTRRIARSWHTRHTRQLRHWRARYDERFAPAKELRATARYLAHAGAVLGRDDLAVQAYHVGISKLRGTSRAYAELYFHGGRVDDYALKVFAAKRILHLFRANRAALAFEAQQQARKSSAEEYLHPRSRTHRYATPGALLRAEQHRTLRLIPVQTRQTHILVGGALGGEAHKFGRSRRLYRALRPAALDVLLYIGKRVHELSGARKPLILTSAVRDLKYQRVLTHVNANAARSYSLHTAGYAFDIARSYGSERQARAFQYVLDRLTAANAIAYIRESAAIHITAASDAPAKLRLLETLG
jgi:soluble lytic murein transglycosylase-like protein